MAMGTRRPLGIFARLDVLLCRHLEKKSLEESCLRS